MFMESCQGKTLDEVLALCREQFEEADYSVAQRWHEQGGKVLGHFQVYFPEEIAHAAGMLPVKLHGGPIEASQATSRFGSYLCSIIKTSLELALSGRLELDMFVSHPICDAARNLAGVWGRNKPYLCEILYLPQNANSSYAVQYLRDEYDRLKGRIEGIVGHQVSDEALRRSTAVFNENRRLLRDLYAIKRDTPWLLSVEEAFALIVIGARIPREEHNQLLRGVIPQIMARPGKKQDKVRIVLEGGFCEMPPYELLRLIAQSCYVVDDDLLIGMRWILEDVPLEGDPLMNLARAYLESSTYSPVQHDLRKPKEKMLLERIRNSNAVAAIVGAAKMCEPGLEDQVAYIKELDVVGIPYFLTEFEERMISFDSLQLQLETFVESILFD
jgi:benzoyl-CoA reductase subunit C